MDRLDGQRVLVGVGGSISAYRACDVVRGLVLAGARVRVAPTRAAAAFVAPLTFEALSGEPIVGSVLEMEAGKIPHVEEAHAATCVVVAPASADLVAKMAAGFGDEALLAILLSYRGPLVVAPAMESNMWSHPATAANVKLLVERGALVVGPDDGPLASGRTGPGRLAHPERIVEAVRAALSKKDLAARRVVVTAGPTVEDIDPVRFLSNRSSGRQGVALARSLAQRGAHVDLVHGPLKVPPPTTPGIVPHPVRSARDMHVAVQRLLEDAGQPVDAVVLCAAVADATPAAVAAQKLKKTEGGLSRIELVPTEDILASVGARPVRPVLVGFAAETHDVERYAAEKLTRKGCDLICANDVSAPGSGFDVTTNVLTLVKAGGDVVRLPQLSKDEAAERIVDEIALLVDARAFDLSDSHVKSRGPEVPG